jgi:hypothetical protein
MVLGWMLLGTLLGVGVSYFVPNLDVRKAALAGLGGGLLGVVAFLVLSTSADVLGRFGGAALLGFCIGLMVAMVEAAFRRAWLDVRFSARESISVNLGTEPVKVGGDARACTVWARGAAPIALRYWIRDGRVCCEDVPSHREMPVADGDTRAVGNVTVVVRFGSGTPTASTAAAPVSAPVIPALPPPPAPAATAPAKATHAEYDDGLPMPLGPPPPPRPAAASILDLDDYRAAPRNPVVGPAAAAPAPPRPAAPVAAKPVPPAPKPAAPAGKATDPDGCPSCGRKSPGQPGARYCMVCDRTF